MSDSGCSRRSSYEETSFDRQYECVSEAEDLKEYGPEGYHPVVLGERLGVYQVVQKLGWGHFSTVWLVYEPESQEYFACKVIKSNPDYFLNSQDEIGLLDTLRLKVDSQENLSVVLKDTFVHHGPFGKHQCMVFEVMGPSLLDLIQHFERKRKHMPMRMVKSIVTQILKALSQIHDQAGIIHTDIKPENIMLTLQPHQLINYVNQLKKVPRKPMSMKYLQLLKNKNNRKNNKNTKKYAKKKAKKQGKKVVNEEQKDDTQEQQEVIQEKQKKDEEVVIEQMEQLKVEEEEVVNKEWDMNILRWKGCVEYDLTKEVGIKVVDFGNACYVDKHFTDNIQTREYRSVEGILRAPYNQSTDMWSLACMVFEMLTNDFLFKPIKDSTRFSADDDHLALIQETLGKLPKKIALGGKDSKDFFNKDGKLISIKRMRPCSMAEILEKSYRMEEEEAKKIEAFLVPMLDYDINRRISAHNALQSPWLQ